MSSTQSNFQSYLDGLKSSRATKQTELTETQELYDYSFSQLQQLQDLHKTYDTKSAELEDLAIEEIENLEKFKMAHLQHQWFERLRESMKLFAQLEPTPQERLVNMHLQKEETLRKQINEVNAELKGVHNKLFLLGSLRQYETCCEEEQQKIERLLAEIKELDLEIEGLETTRWVLLQQQEKETQLSKYVNYLIEYWYDGSGKWIRSFLLTSGPNKNVPFAQQSIDQMVEYLDQTLLPHRNFMMRNETSSGVYRELRERFTADQLIAFAHTLHLEMFPKGFFEGETGGFGLEKSADDSLTYVGVDAWQASDVMVDPSYGHDHPQTLTDAVSNGNESARFYYSFHLPQVGEVSTTKQLCNLRRFLQDFWRYRNFFEFDIEAKLNVYPVKVAPKVQKTEYCAYKKKGRAVGNYLLV